LGDAGSRLLVCHRYFFFLFGDWMALIYKTLWVADAFLFVTSTILNGTSHGAKYD